MPYLGLSEIVRDTKNLFIHITHSQTLTHTHRQIYIYIYIYIYMEDCVNTVNDTWSVNYIG